MKLDRHIMELMSIVEKTAEWDSYTLIPQLLREEVVEIRWKPIFSKDERGMLTHLNHQFEVIYNEKA